MVTSEDRIGAASPAVVGINSESAPSTWRPSPPSAKLSGRRSTAGAHETLRKSPPRVVGMEACLSAHLVSCREHRGARPRFIPAIYVKPFR